MNLQFSSEQTVTLETFSESKKYESENCMKCRTSKFCISKNLNPNELQEFNNSVHQRRMVRKGEKLLSSGMNFSSIHIIRSGSFKTLVNTISGQGHLVGFPMSGYCMGLDGFGKEKYESEAIAIEDSVVCSISVREIERLIRIFPNFLKIMMVVMSEEITRENKNMIYFSQMSAEQKLAIFIQDMIHQLMQRGYSGSEVNLRMTRFEIGQHLGLTMETISRTFSKFAKIKMLVIDNKNIKLLDTNQLKRISEVGV